MKTRTVAIIAVAAGALAMFLMDRIPLAVHGSEKMPVSIAAVPGTVGTQDVTGPYEVVEHWPKPLSNLPGHAKLDMGSDRGRFRRKSESDFHCSDGGVTCSEKTPDFCTSKRRAKYFVPDCWFTDPKRRRIELEGQVGVDHRFEHGIVVVDSDGNIVEQWTQWDKLLKQPHAVFINQSYDSDKNVWVVDDGLSQIFKFSNDGKRLLTIGIANEMGSDEKHFGSPTFLAWLPDSTMFVADGYVNSRVVKFDKDGKYLTAWGQKGNPPSDVRPGYFNTVHGIAVGPATRQVYVNDQDNHRIQIFDEDEGFWISGRLIRSHARRFYIYPPMGGSGLVTAKRQKSSSMT